MALLNLVGFETGDLSEVGFLGGAGENAQATVKRTGTYAAELAGSGGSAPRFIIQKPGADGKSVALGGSAIYLTAWVRISVVPTDARECINILTGAGNTAVAVYFNTSSQMFLSYRDGSAIQTSIGSGFTYSLNTWYRIDLVGTGLNSAGNLACSLYVDGSLIASGSSLTTSAADTAMGVQFNVSSSNATFFVDDVWIDDAAFPTDDYGIKVAVPTGDSATNTDWTASAGNKWACVDEIPPDGADYISSGTGAGAKDYSATHAAAATLGVTGNIIGVKAVSRMKEVTSTTTLGAIGIRSGTTDFATTEVDIGSTTVITMEAVYETDPNTSAAWSESGFNAAEPLVRRSTSDTSDIRCEALYLMVAYAAAASTKPFRRALLGVGV